MPPEIDTERVLVLLAERGEFRSDQLAAELGLDHQRLVGLIKSLQSQEGVCF
jgi:DNA-binding MarR family transcriptional regulator